MVVYAFVHNDQWGSINKKTSIILSIFWPLDGAGFGAGGAGWVVVMKENLGQKCFFSLMLNEVLKSCEK